MIGSARLRAPILAFVGLAALACHKEEPKTADVFFEAPPAAPVLPVSRFGVPLSYDFTSILAIIERAVPKKFGSLDSAHVVGTDSSKHYSFEAVRGPFVAFADGKLMHLRATLSYAARGYYKPLIGPTLGAGCGNDKDRPRVVVELLTPLSLTSNWHLKSHARIVKIAPASDSARDHCSVSILKIDVTDRVVDAAEHGIEGKLPDIDEKIAGIDLKSHFEEWWGLLSKPIQLTDGIWLLMGPEQLRLGRVRGEGHTLFVDAELDARPKVITGAEPPAGKKPLPPLARGTVFDGFHIMMEGVVDYGTASRAITDATRGKHITVGGRTVSATGVVVTPRKGGKLALAITFAGDAAGTLVFSGVPRFDPKRGELFVPDLDYDLNSNDQLINSYSWLRSDVLRSAFRQRARVPVQPILERGRQLLGSGLNRKLGDAVTLSATVDSVSVKGLYVTRDGVVVRAEATGDAGMAVKQKRKR